MEQKKIINNTIKDQKEQPDLWEAMRYLKQTADLFNSRLSDLPKIKNELVKIHDRLQFIESCLSNKGFLVEDV